MYLLICCSIFVIILLTLFISLCQNEFSDVLKKANKDLNSISGYNNKRFPMSQNDLDTKISNVIENTKKKLLTLVKSFKNDVVKDSGTENQNDITETSECENQSNAVEESEIENQELTITNQDLKSWFAFTISSLNNNNKVKTEKSFKDIKKEYLVKFINKARDDIESNDGSGTKLLFKQNELFRNSSEDISGSIRYVNADNNKEVFALNMKCRRCGQKNEFTDEVSKYQEILFDDFEKLIQQHPCAKCNWTLDPSLFETVRIEFEQNAVILIY